jgi:MFS transporter, DHA1 family, multidrug resistance protein
MARGTSDGRADPSSRRGRPRASAERSVRDEPGKVKPDTFAFTALLSYLISFGPLSIDLFLPSMPAIGTSFAEPVSVVQLTISLYLVGFAIGQIVYGPFSDRYGRKPALFTAFLIFSVSSLVCLVAPSIEVLVVGRIGQAIGASGAQTVTRAVVRDYYEGARAGRQLSVMSFIMSLWPVATPLIGGALVMLFGWRASFILLVGAGALAGFLVWRFLPETFVPSDAPMRSVLQNYRRIARHPIFLANLVFGSVAYAGVFAWITASPFVLQKLLDLTPFTYAIMHGCAFAGFALGGAVATQVVLRLGLDLTAGLGALALAVSSAVMLAAVATIDGFALAIMLTFGTGVYVFGMGLLLPQVIATALTPFPHHAGAAAALIGFSQQCAGAILGAIIGFSLGSTVWPMPIGSAVCGVTAFLLWVATREMRLQLEAADLHALRDPAQ